MKNYLVGQLAAIQKIYNEQSHIEDAKRRLLDALPFWIAGMLTALAATVYSQVFKFTEEQALSLYSRFGYFSLIMAPCLFVLSWACVELFAPYSNGSGIPQLMAAAEISKKDATDKFLEKLLGVRIIVVKVVSSLLGVLGGGAIGREGPTLQIAGSIFHLTGRAFSKNLWSKNHHGLILAGGAAGLASAFNTPLGGIAYVVEELSRSHLSSFRTGILHAVIMAGLVAQLMMGPYLYFGYPKIETFQMSSIGQMLLISILVGLLAALFGQALKLVITQKTKVKTGTKKIFLAAFCGFLIAGFALFLSQAVMGSGKDLLTGMLFDGKQAGARDVISRFFGTVVTYAAGGAGGIFAPTLSIGGAFASYLSGFFSAGLGPLSVLIGMTAALAGLTHSPLTSFILILEMTDRHSAIFPLMIAALIGHGVSKFISKDSFYEFMCRRILANAPQADNVV